MPRLDREAIKLIEGKNFGSLATLMKDGSPQVTVVWIDHDGEHILVNTAEGRTKERNVSRDSRVAITVFDSDNPYHSLVARGRVVEVTKEGAEEHIDKMALKYLGKKYPWRVPSEKRIVLKIRPEKIRVG